MRQRGGAPHSARGQQISHTHNRAAEMGRARSAERSAAAAGRETPLRFRRARSRSDTPPRRKSSAQPWTQPRLRTPPRRRTPQRPRTPPRSRTTARPSASPSPRTPPRPRTTTRPGTPSPRTPSRTPKRTTPPRTREESPKPRKPALKAPTQQRKVRWEEEEAAVTVEGCEVAVEGLDGEALYFALKEAGVGVSRAGLAGDSRRRRWVYTPGPTWCS
eukprot:TRINITY_DN4833_c0_g1_i2.p2 TRINITY_DN4833_c0_g1~~TRINITY_DN4833_c0_g1_i2.p2  ORF type:complete len:217 (+),score=36.42 TRINITY_DN4833_c0_g1_i2:810-1460(+)